MKYSVIICYRNREAHLKILVPRLKAVFGDTAEIIVVEQNDSEKFLRGQMFNAGAQAARGDVLVFHDVDHYPVDANYDPMLATPGGIDVLCPIVKIEYVRNDLTPKPIEEVPSGYRHFKDGVDYDFFGGVSVFKRDAFFRINGFNSLYRGWGLEDADLRERIQHYGLTRCRDGVATGLFYALDHTDSNPGVQDADFQRSQQMFQQWRNYLAAGVNTQHQTMNEVPSPIEGVDRWLKVSNVITVPSEVKPFISVENLADFYADTPEKHTAIWMTLKQLVNENDILRNHRNWVISNNFGYGNRAFHWMWNIIVAGAPANFKFLEIGVYMGQIVSLVSMLNRIHKKNGLVYGITPLTNAGDKYSKHPEVNYEEAIQRIFYECKLDGSDFQLIQGLSNDPDIIATAEGEGPFDIIYIDGCHDYPVVVSDITNYSNMLKVGGLMVIDDVSNYLNIPNGLIRMDWRGLEDVSNAARDTIEKDSRFRHLFAVGHNRVWRRIA